MRFVELDEQMGWLYDENQVAVCRYNTLVGVEQVLHNETELLDRIIETSSDALQSPKEKKIREAYFAQIAEKLEEAKALAAKREARAATEAKKTGDLAAKHAAELLKVREYLQAVKDLDDAKARNADLQRQIAALEQSRASASPPAGGAAS